MNRCAARLSSGRIRIRAATRFVQPARKPIQLQKKLTEATPAAESGAAKIRLPIFL